MSFLVPANKLVMELFFSSQQAFNHHLYTYKRTHPHSSTHARTPARPHPPWQAVTVVPLPVGQMTNEETISVYGQMCKLLWYLPKQFSGLPAKNVPHEAPNGRLGLWSVFIFLTENATPVQLQTLALLLTNTEVDWDCHNMLVTAEFVF